MAAHSSGVLLHGGCYGGHFACLDDLWHLQRLPSGAPDGMSINTLTYSVTAHPKVPLLESLTPRTYGWRRVAATGALPAARWGHTLVPAATTDVLALFGGNVATATGEYVDANDLHLLVLSPQPGGGVTAAWSQPRLAPPLPPPRRRHTAAIIGTAAPVLYVFGGLEGAKDYLDDTAVIEIGAAYVASLPPPPPLPSAPAPSALPLPVPAFAPAAAAAAGGGAAASAPAPAPARAAAHATTEGVPLARSASATSALESATRDSDRLQAALVESEGSRSRAEEMVSTLAAQLAATQASVREQVAADEEARTALQAQLAAERATLRSAETSLAAAQAEVAAARAEAAAAAMARDEAARGAAVEAAAAADAAARAVEAAAAERAAVAAALVRERDAAAADAAAVAAELAREREEGTASRAAADAAAAAATAALARAQAEAATAREAAARAETTVADVQRAAAAAATEAAAAATRAAASAADLKSELAAARRRLADAAAAFTCSLCLDRPLDTVVVPCGHLFCAACQRTMAVTTCPMCRTRISAATKAYLDLAAVMTVT